MPDGDNNQVPSDEIASLRREILLMSAGLGGLIGVTIYAAVKALVQQRPDLLWVPVALAVIVTIMARGVLRRRRCLQTNREK